VVVLQVVVIVMSLGFILFVTVLHIIGKVRVTACAVQDATVAVPCRREHELLHLRCCCDTAGMPCHMFTEGFLLPFLSAHTIRFQLDNQLFQLVVK
jgi:hypothetical protein